MNLLKTTYLLLKVLLDAKFMMGNSEKVLQLCFSAYKLPGSWFSNLGHLSYIWACFHSYSEASRTGEPQHHASILSLQYLDCSRPPQFWQECVQLDNDILD
jgi:hypothetical protein